MPAMYAYEYKKAIITRYEKGESLTALSEEEHIALSTLYRWRKSYHTITTDTRTYTPAKFDVLTRRLQKLEHELEIIRLSKYIDDVSLKKKLDFLEQTYQQYEQYNGASILHHYGGLHKFWDGLVIERLSENKKVRFSNIFSKNGLHSPPK